MLVNLRALLGVVIDIVRLKGGPESLPTSTALLVVVVVLNAAITVAFASQLAPDVMPRLPLELAVDIGATLLWFQVALNLAKRRERFVQTLTAVFAVRALFTLALMPLGTLLAAQLAAKEPIPVSIALPTLALGIWLLVIEVRIIQSAFEWTKGAALALVMGQKFAVALLFALAAGPTTAGAT